MSPTLPDTWSRVLLQVEEAIARALDDARAREQALGSPEAAPAEPSLSPQTTPGGAPARLGQAEVQTAAADETLRQAEVVLRRWREQTGAVARKLANWDTRRV
jgi:hypothetical protein